MNRKHFYSLKLIPVVLIILLLAVACRRDRTTQQQPADQASDSVTQTGTLLFRDDFQDGQAQEWSINSAWNVQQFGDVYLFGASALGGAWVTNGGGWSDYTYQSSIRVNSGVLLISINLSQSGRYGLHLGEDGAYLFEEQPAGTFNILAEAGPITTTTWHTVSFASQNGHVQVSLDQVVWFDVNDSTPAAGGTIAVSALDDSHVGVDNVLVTRIQGTLPSAATHAPAPLSPEPVQVEDIQQEADALTVEEADTEVEAEPPAPLIETGGLPDLVLDDVSFVPSPIIQGQPFTANFMVTNMGNATSGAFTFRLHFHAAAGIADCNMDVMSLDPGASAWSGCVRTINGNTGNYPYEVTADVEGEINESNEDNNASSGTITVQAAPQAANQPDLIIGDVGEEEPDYIHCGIDNIGSVDAPGNVVLAFFINGEFYSQMTIGPAIPAGLGYGALVFINSNDSPNHPFEAKCVIDYTDIVAESNEGNNGLTVTIP